jgi:hypothetical protein
MKRFAACPHANPGYIIVDTLCDRVVALYADHRAAERAAARLNGEPVLNTTAKVFRSAEEVVDAMMKYRQLAEQNR